MSKKIQEIVTFGNNAQQFLTFVTFLAVQCDSPNEFFDIGVFRLEITAMIDNLATTFHTVVNNIVNHPNHDIYGFLQDYLLEIDEK